MGDEDDEVKITSLNYFPLLFDEGGLHELLTERGKMFWKCRTKHFVSYSDEESGILSSVSVQEKPQSDQPVSFFVNSCQDRLAIDT